MGRLVLHFFLHARALRFRTARIGVVVDDDDDDGIIAVGSYIRFHFLLLLVPMLLLLHMATGFVGSDRSDGQMIDCALASRTIKQRSPVDLLGVGLGCVFAPLFK